jgi:ribokinase
MSAPSVVVVGSVNLDMVATVESLPVPGETVTGASLSRFPGGKGANQALAARRLGAEVSLIAAVGNDAEADLALALLRDGGVHLETCIVDDMAPTGVALIAVSDAGENQIVVAPGANRMLAVDHVEGIAGDALICQLETPIPVLDKAVGVFDGFTCVNLAPAADVPDSVIAGANLVVVNETEAAFYGDRLAATNGLVAETFGARGARLKDRGTVVAEAAPPTVEAVDTTGAGDTFTAALTVGLVEGMGHQRALEFACAAGALAATRAGAQPSLPLRAEVDALVRA